MLRVDIQFNNNLTPAIRKIQQALKKYPQQAEDKFVSLTPVRSGNARNNTVLKNDQTIVANYPYAQRLDQGYSSQAPNGMVAPFEKWIAAKVKQIFGK